jgi:hypothetical protein
LVSLLRTSSHAQKQTPTRMAIATTVPAKTISSGTFLPPLLRMCGSEDPGHRLHRCPTTPPEGHRQRTRRLVEPVATGLAGHRAQALSACSTPSGRRTDWTCIKPRAAGVAHASALRESRSAARRLSLSRESRSADVGDARFGLFGVWRLRAAEGLPLVHGCRAAGRKKCALCGLADLRTGNR